MSSLTNAHRREELHSLPGLRGSTAGLDLFPQRFMVKPRTGALVVFPAWLQHYVHAYRGTRPRLAISANLVML